MKTSTLHPIATVAVLVFLHPVLCQRTQAQVTLDQLVAINLPLGVIPHRLVVSDDGQIAVLANDAGFLLIGAQREPRFIGQELGFLAGVQIQGTSAQVIDLDTATLWRLDWPRGIDQLPVFLQELPLDSLQRLKQAIEVGGSWVLLVESSDGQAAVHTWRPGQTMTRRTTNSRLVPPSSVMSAAGYHLARIADAAVLTQLRPPFHLGYLDPDTPSPEIEFQVQDVGALVAEKAGNWVSLPALRLGGETLQILVDLLSDRRLWVVRDHAGAVLRQSLKTVPVSVTASSPDGLFVAGIRSITRYEAVLFAVLDAERLPQQDLGAEGVVRTRMSLPGGINE